MARYDLPRAAEGPLRLVQLFVNSTDKEHGREWLPTADALADWLAEHGLTRPDGVTAADLNRAHELREAIRALLRANNVGGDTAGAVEIVNQVATRGELTLQLAATGHVEIAVRGAGVDGALARIVAVIFEASLDGSFTRLKACRNCGWSFYDPSKNRSGTWCSMQICGNRTKTRAYRRRKAGVE